MDKHKRLSTIVNKKATPESVRSYLLDRGYEKTKSYGWVSTTGKESLIKQNMIVIKHGEPELTKRGLNNLQNTMAILKGENRPLSANEIQKIFET